MSFGAAGRCRQGSLTPGPSPGGAGGKWGCRCGNGNEFVAFLLLAGTRVFGCCLLLCAPGGMWLCPPSSPQCLGALRNQLKRDLGGKKRDREGVRLRGEGLCPLSGVSVAILVRGRAGGRTARLSLSQGLRVLPGTSPASLSRCGISASASAPAAREIKDTAAAVPALEISCSLGCAGQGGGIGLQLELLCLFWDVQECCW